MILTKIDARVIVFLLFSDCRWNYNPRIPVLNRSSRSMRSYFEEQHRQEPCQELFDEQHRADQATMDCDTLSADMDSTGLRSVVLRYMIQEPEKCCLVRLRIIDSTIYCFSIRSLINWSCEPSLHQPNVVSGNAGARASLVAVH